MFAPAEIVESGGRIKSHRVPQAVGDKGVYRRAFIDLVEMGERLTRKEFCASFGMIYRRAFDVVEQAFDQIGRGTHILEPLLILDANRRATKVMGNAYRRDVHFALFEN